ncbi:hypothetical protein FQZ97_1082030 [compost metagenome]
MIAATRSHRISDRVSMRPNNAIEPVLGRQANMARATSTRSPRSICADMAYSPMATNGATSRKPPIKAGTR